MSLGNAMVGIDLETGFELEDFFMFVVLVEDFFESLSFLLLAEIDIDG